MRTAKQPTIIEALRPIVARLQRIERMVKKMSITVDQLITEVDAATTLAASNVKNIIDTLKKQNGTLTQAQQDAADATLAHLAAIGSDPANPVPTAPPVVPEP